VEIFSEKEIKEALDDMKTNSTPGPDDFTMSFFKKKLGASERASGGNVQQIL
jgi:hypothetical protein